MVGQLLSSGSLITNRIGKKRSFLERAQRPFPAIKALRRIDEREHIDLTPICTLVKRNIKEVTNYKDLVAIVGGSMPVMGRDKEVALVRACLVKAKEAMKTAIGNNTTLKKRLLDVDVDGEIAEIHKRLSERFDAKKDPEMLIARAVNEVNEMDVEVVNLKEAMSTLNGPKVVDYAFLQSLNDLRNQLGKTIEEILQFQ